ncbi:proline/betaine ABC transporter permease ProW, partial [Pectobacterium brasiliense]|nr:proline/betaine ABC transporter permease ProW [Pectobacterium brasiliense]
MSKSTSSPWDNTTAQSYPTDQSAAPEQANGAQQNDPWSTSTQNAPADSTPAQHSATQG